MNDRSEGTIQLQISNFSELNDVVLSAPFFIRNLPWKIMAMPRVFRTEKSLGYFLQCNRHSKSITWACFASLELRLLSVKPNVNTFVKVLNHRFDRKAEDYGFGNFMTFHDILLESNGFIKNNKIILEAFIAAEVPEGIPSNVKEISNYKCYAGLINQGATCYMNSLLQTLFFINKFRKVVYKIPIKLDGPLTVGLAIQIVFYRLQCSKKVVGTKILTRSFGWEPSHAFIQHDVHEFLRIILEKIENCMEKTPVTGTIAKLFEGKMTSYVRCINVTWSSYRLETFYDIQLNIKGKTNIYEAFKEYIAEELLDGDNKYDAGPYGLQDAKKGVSFKMFPPILYLQLMRFQYDPYRNCTVKCNNYFEFYEKICLNEFLTESEMETSADYLLYAIIVHIGNHQQGHYVVFINPNCEGLWYKFNDELVTKSTKKEAINDNYGGTTETHNNSTNAYLLVYMHISELEYIFQDVKYEDVPKMLIELMKQGLETKQTVPATEVTVKVILEEYFMGHKDSDLYDISVTPNKTFKIAQNTTIMEVEKIISVAFNYSINEIRLWPIKDTIRGALRPSFLNVQDNPKKILKDVSGNCKSWDVFLEVLFPNRRLLSVPSFDPNLNCLLFFKMYDPLQKDISYYGHHYALLNSKVIDLEHLLNARAGFPSGTSLLYYEEIKSNSIEKIANINNTLREVLVAPMNTGSILIFEKNIPEQYENCIGYFQNLHSKMNITFINKFSSTDDGVVVELDEKMTYTDMAKAVAEKINVPANYLQFFWCNKSCIGYMPGNPLNHNLQGSLVDIFNTLLLKAIERIYYLKLTVNIEELVNRKMILCSYMDAQFKEIENITLYPITEGTVFDILEEANKRIPCSKPESRKLRLVEIMLNKIIGIHPVDEPIMALKINYSQFYRIEEIPENELIMTEDELLLPCAHFERDPLSTFGTPFYIKIQHGKPFIDVKVCIQNRLRVSDTEFATFKFGIMDLSNVKFITDPNYIINLSEFVPATKFTFQSWLGLQHKNKDVL